MGVRVPPSAPNNSFKYKRLRRLIRNSRSSLFVRWSSKWSSRLVTPIFNNGLQTHIEDIPAGAESRQNSLDFPSPPDALRTVRTLQTLKSQQHPTECAGDDVASLGAPSGTRPRLLAKRDVSLQFPAFAVPTVSSTGGLHLGSESQRISQRD